MASLVACQRPGGAFLRTGTAKVVSCVETPKAAPAAGDKGKKAKPAPSASSSSSPPPPAGPTFDVVLSDTVLFPEGGGQPSDTGVIEVNGEQINVLSVARIPGGALHRVEKPVPVGAEVSLTVDWPRRFDHMQCHSSQHLISAVARSTYGWKTLSWWLASAPQECFIELDTGADGISPAQLTALEDDVNGWIRRGVPMKLHTFPSLAEARADPFFQANISKALRDSQEGAIRVIEIEGLEFNPCCGTHLETTAQMQAIKLTRVEKGKASTKLFFLTGGRTLAALQSALDIQRALNTSLCCSPDQFPDAVKRLQSDLKSGSKLLASVQKDLAGIDAANLLASVQAGSSLAYLHRDELGLNYLTLVADILADTIRALPSPPPAHVVLMTSTDGATGAAASSGPFLLLGDEALVSKFGPLLAPKLQGKGGGRKGKFQGKGTALDAKSRDAARVWLADSLKEVQKAE